MPTPNKTFAKKNQNAIEEQRHLQPRSQAIEALLALRTKMPSVNADKAPCRPTRRVALNANGCRYQSAGSATPPTNPLNPIAVKAVRHPMGEANDGQWLVRDIFSVENDQVAPIFPFAVGLLRAESLRLRLTVRSVGQKSATEE